MNYKELVLSVYPKSRFSYHNGYIDLLAEFPSDNIKVLWWEDITYYRAQREYLEPEIWKNAWLNIQNEIQSKLEE